MLPSSSPVDDDGDVLAYSAFSASSSSSSSALTESLAAASASASAAAAAAAAAAACASELPLTMMAADAHMNPFLSKPDGRTAGNVAGMLQRMVPARIADLSPPLEASTSGWSALAYDERSILPYGFTQEDYAFDSDVPLQEQVPSTRKRKRTASKNGAVNSPRVAPRTPPHQIASETPRVPQPTHSNWTTLLINTPITPLPSPSQVTKSGGGNRTERDHGSLKPLAESSDGHVKVGSDLSLDEVTGTYSLEVSPDAPESLYVLVPIPGLPKSSPKRRAIPKSQTVDVGDSILIPKGSPSSFSGQRISVPKSIISEVHVATEADSDSELVPIPGLSEDSTLRMAVPKVLMQRAGHGSPSRRGKAGRRKNNAQSLLNEDSKDIAPKTKGTTSSRSRKARDRDVTLVLEEAVEALTQKKNIEEARRREEEAHRLGSLGFYHAELKKLVESKPQNVGLQAAASYFTASSDGKRRRRQSTTVEDRSTITSSSSWYPNSLLPTHSTSSSTWLPNTLPMAMDIQSWTPNPGPLASSTASDLVSLLQDASTSAAAAGGQKVKDVSERGTDKQSAKSSGLDLLAFAAGWGGGDACENEDSVSGSSPGKAGVGRKKNKCKSLEEHQSDEESDFFERNGSDGSDEEGIISAQILEKLAPFSRTQRTALGSETFTDLLEAADLLSIPSGAPSHHPLRSGARRAHRLCERHRRQPLVPWDALHRPSPWERTLLSSIRSKTGEDHGEDSHGLCNDLLMTALPASRCRLRLDPRPLVVEGTQTSSGSESEGVERKRFGRGGVKTLLGCVRRSERLGGGEEGLGPTIKVKHGGKKVAGLLEGGVKRRRPLVVGVGFWEE
ncbi:hypothetical protein HDU67_006595 [Dinochytrium kinnereticum]|nr:hypothetical protein HDU67_006595 [Dinochytrium kinnereticum]